MIHDPLEVRGDSIGTGLRVEALRYAGECHDIGRRDPAITDQVTAQLGASDSSRQVAFDQRRLQLTAGWWHLECEVKTPQMRGINPLGGVRDPMTLYGFRSSL